MNIKQINKYKTLSLAAKASLWYMSCTILQKCLSLVTVPIFTRIMTEEQYGMYSTYLAIVTILTIILTMNFDTCAYMNGIVKFDNEQDKKNLAGSLLILSSLLTIVFSIIIYSGKNIFIQILDLPIELIYLMLLEILFIPPVRFWMVEQRFKYKYRLLVIVTLGMFIFNSGLGIIFVLNAVNNQAFYRILSIVLVQVIIGSVLFFKFFKSIRNFKVTQFWKYGLKLNLPLIPHALSLQVLLSSDRIMINSMVGSVQAAIYSVAYSAAQIVNAIKLSIVDAIRPWIYGKLKEKDYDSIRKTTSMLFLLNILATFFMVALAPEIIKVLASDKYYEAIYVIPPIAASSYFTFIYNICSIVEIYFEKNNKVMIASSVAAVTNLVLNYALIPIFGYIVAGYTTLISYIVLCIMHLIILGDICKRKLHGIKLIDIKSIILQSILVIGLSIIFTFSYKYIIIRYMFLLILSFACFHYRDKVKEMFFTIKISKKRKN